MFIVFDINLVSRVIFHTCGETSSAGDEFAEPRSHGSLPYFRNSERKEVGGVGCDRQPDIDIVSTFVLNCVLTGSEYIISEQCLSFRWKNRNKH